MNSLDLTKRQIKSGHYAKRERRQGLIPGVLYGKKTGNLLFEVGAMELGREISSSGEHGILNYNLNGRNERAILKEVQRDPVSHKIIHIDLEKIAENQEIQSEVPIQFLGEEWLNKKGAVLQKERGVVKVSCSAESLPKTIKIDVSKGELGVVYKYKDLEVGEEISIIDNIDGVIASISNERKITSELLKEEIAETELQK